MVLEVETVFIPGHFQEMTTVIVVENRECTYREISFFYFLAVISEPNENDRGLQRYSFDSCR